MTLDREVCYRALLARDARFDGQFFAAVRTTGVYCRPVCPARTPMLDNVVFLPSAAAAELAGFRPCLRCRPEASPETAAWRGSAAAVSRGVALIAAGALDEGGVDGLAERLGMGGRQLRRLFRRHLGASPAEVARTRRFLFARQLIAETSLPMTQVALAAGFGSVRRFNDAFLARHGQPPGALRRRKLPTNASEAVTLTLRYRPPYDWAALTGFLALRAIPGVEQVRPDRYARTITLDGVHGAVTVRPHPERHALIASIRFPVVAALPAIAARLRRMFDLGADPAAIGDCLRSDPHLARLVAARPGLRVPGAWDGFELAVRGVLGQQVTVAAATQLAGKLVAAFGEELPPPEPAWTEGPCFAFPSPAALAEADIGSALGMPAARAAAIAGLARAAMADPRLFTPCRGLDDSVSRLTALPGIGAWTAHYICMRALREPDAFPAADVALLRAMADAAGRPSSARLLARAESWRPWRAYAALHLWTSLTEAPLAVAA